jgi:two-component system LytT family sensor kinase
MKTFSLRDLMDQRKLISHIGFVSFSIIVTVSLTLTGKYGTNPKSVISLFVMLWFQLEVFIFFGNLLFSRVNFDRRPGEITKLVLFRFVIFLAICILVSLIIYLFLLYTLALIESGDLSLVMPEFIHNQALSWFRSTISGLSLGALIFIVILWQTSLRREQKLREENLIFLNETLKNQINPHFLFNSLNTLSSLIATQPDIAEQFIQRLSSIYRYILENSRKDKVPLLEELTFINNYFELFRIRDAGKIFLAIDAPESEKYNILPVSLQILVENAIKHNMATRENPLNIHIFIEEAYVVVENNLQTMASGIRSTGIGLKNLGERVRIISGKELIIQEANHSFKVKLPLIK